MFGKQQGITAEEMTQKEIDACVDGGWGETFQSTTPSMVAIPTTRRLTMRQIYLRKNGGKVRND